MKYMQDSISQILRGAALVAFILFSTITFAQKPQNILGIAKEKKSISYYEEQATLWEKETKSDPDNGQAWINWYKAERAKLQLKDPRFWSNEKPAFYAKIQHVVDQCKKNKPNSFEYHYLQGLNSEKLISIKHLKKAYEIDPERSEIYGWLLSYYIPLFDNNKCAEISKKMLKANIYGNNTMMWNLNALNSVEKNGVFIALGDMDGSPKWVLQHGAKERTDITIVHASLMSYVPDYLKGAYKLIGLSPPTKTLSDFRGAKEYQEYLTADILQRSTRPAYVSSGVSKEVFKRYQISEKMYVVGNVLRYSEVALDNSKIIEDNIFNKYNMQYILNDFQSHPDDDIVHQQLDIAYLPALFNLKKYYCKTGDKNKEAKVTHYVDLIIDRSGNKEQLIRWFGQSK